MFGRSRNFYCYKRCHNCFKIGHIRRFCPEIIEKQRLRENQQICNDTLPIEGPPVPIEQPVKEQTGFRMIDEDTSECDSCDLSHHSSESSNYWFCDNGSDCDCLVCEEERDLAEYDSDEDRILSAALDELELVVVSVGTQTELLDDPLLHTIPE